MTREELEDIVASLLKRSFLDDEEAYARAVTEFELELKGRGLVTLE